MKTKAHVIMKPVLTLFHKLPGDFKTMVILKCLSKIEQHLISILLLFNVAILFVTVALRYLFNNPPVWPEEASRYVMIWIIYLGVSQSIENNTEIKIDILSQLVPSSLFKRVLHLTASVISICMAVFMVVYGIEFTRVLNDTQQVAASFPMKMSFLFAIIPIAGVLMTLKFGMRIASQISKLNS